DLWAWWASTEKARDIIVGGRFERVVQMAMKRGKYTVRKADITKFSSEVELVKKVYTKPGCRTGASCP
ncbi:MAG: hypothetical protein M1546_04570, partial [Chloroflexi bacterium]|nr:hypothetical protein [Chloroflexota bacterium]